MLRLLQLELQLAEQVLLVLELVELGLPAVLAVPGYMHILLVFQEYNHMPVNLHQMDLPAVQDMLAALELHCMVAMVQIPEHCIRKAAEAESYCTDKH